MIKINLALRKSTGTMTKTTPLSNVDVSTLLNPSVRVTLLCVIIVVVMQQYTDNQKTELVQGLSAEIEAVTKQGEELKKSLGKMKQYEEVKQALEGNEKVIKTKLETISTLSQGRDGGVRVLQALSQSIPKDVWVIELKVDGSETLIKGGSTDFAQISDFSARLSQSGTFSEVQQQDSNNEKDAEGENIIVFGLGAKRN